MASNPVAQRELLGLLRSRGAVFVQVGLALFFAVLVILRWPTEGRVDLAGSQSRQVFQVFTYGLATAVLLLIPVFPATSIVRERLRGTLALLLNSPLHPATIYFGKLAGILAFTLLLLIISMPAAAACLAMGGVSWQQVALVYGILALGALQYISLALLVSTRAGSADSAARITYGLVFCMSVLSLGPYLFLQGKPGNLTTVAEWLRCLSPLTALMEILGQGDVAGQGVVSASGTPGRFALLAAISTLAFMGYTISRLNYTLFDRSRSSGVMTDERSLGQRRLRRLWYLVDPQRRKREIGFLVNPVMVKEFRSRRFGRSHWLLRLVSICALASVLLTYATATSTLNWGVETIGAIMVVLQVALIVLLTPSLAAGLVSTERESGGWDLLRMTPLSAAKILRGKLMSVVWTLLLILLATLPGYAIMVYIRPATLPQVSRVLICLVLTAVFAMAVSAAASSLFRRTAVATAFAYTLLLTVCAATLLFWLGEDAPFGRHIVEKVLIVNPVAAALSVIELPGFQDYELVPANWWFLGGGTLVALLILLCQTWRLTRPQ